jgi:hypothetical protein
MSTFERLKKGRLNRAERRELGRRVAAGDPGLAIVHGNAGGIDVGNESHFVAVPPDRDENPVREFGCWTQALNEMAGWLTSCRVDTVAVQATGVYWIALYDVLEQHGIRVVLANAQHTKNVPGRKTDVQECQCLIEVTHLRAAARFLPPAAGHGIRTHDLALAGSTRQRCGTRGAAYAESADEDERAAGQCDQRHLSRAE